MALVFSARRLCRLRRSARMDIEAAKDISERATMKASDSKKSPSGTSLNNCVSFELALLASTTRILSASNPVMPKSPSYTVMPKSRSLWHVMPWQAL